MYNEIQQGCVNYTNNGRRQKQIFNKEGIEC